MQNPTNSSRSWGSYLATSRGSLLVASALAVTALGGTAGCRVTEDNVRRWSDTEHGPDKLVAVLTHAKYETSLRTSAALALIGMKPRGGRRIGINRAVESIAQLSVDERKAVLDGLAPTLIAKMKETSPGNQGAAAAQAAADPSVPFKDAAFALLSYDKSTLVTDDATRKKLSDALIDWCQHDFDRRIDNSSQMYGMEQVLRFLRAPAVKGLPALIVPDEPKIDRIAALIAELGDDATKEAASTKLVDVAKAVASPTWIAKKQAAVEEANKAAKITATAAQLAAQMAAYQTEELTRTFAAMKKVGGRAVIGFCLDFASDKGSSPVAVENEKRRAASMAALEGRLDRNRPDDVQRVLAIAGADDTPDSVRDLAFQRVGEMPREQVVGRLFDLFSSKKWKVRWVSASTVLRMSATPQLGEFMTKLPSGAAAGFALSEPLSYGGLIEKMTVKDGLKARDAATKFLREGSLAAHLTALGWFYANGTPADVAALASFEADATPVPKTDDPDAKWQCDVPKGTDGKETETKPIANLGEFVKFCVEPAMKGRT